ncbi:CK1 family protein kinase [Trichomonas vaginalis G3]|uniref:non-specific serine/threonine protein kinase n=1 Tax=Trichomonas vaginalis (strain ATCC PRA-98 / G3) TaxID=412133 RepID=A2FL85_TRIV3|nr:CK1 family protein kinase [Trichomonas vaginalis G3]|eukprot:XP_001307271.1 CK1 family protein kinase [Trichomonas vaginalis G3]
MKNAGPRTKDLISQVINDRFIIRRHLGGGSFGDVYEAEDMETQQIVALKFETGAATNPQLPNEYKCYKTLDGGTNIPKIYGLFDYQKSRVLAMEKMGPSLESLYKRCGKRFNLKTVLMIADQMLRAIEYVHNSGLLHRDIKPHNFLVGRNENRHRIYIIDFGVSTQYIDPRTKEHYMYTSNNGLIGTAHYVSVNTHLGELQSRRDDLESIAYVLIRFLKGSLPWQSIKVKSVEERNEKITQMKIQTQPDILCAGLPREFKEFYKYARRLKYEETPKYAWIRQMFTSLFIKHGFVNDSVFEWDEEAKIHRPLPAFYLQSNARRYMRANERKIRARKDKVVLPEPRAIFYLGWKN